MDGLLVHGTRHDSVNIPGQGQPARFFYIGKRGPGGIIPGKFSEILSDGQGRDGEEKNLSGLSLEAGPFDFDDLQRKPQSGGGLSQNPRVSDDQRMAEAVKIILFQGFHNHLGANAQRIAHGDGKGRYHILLFESIERK
jgi:hypothetical protein